MTERVLVIGGSGFIGRNLCRKLIAMGKRPVVFDLMPPQIAGCEFHQGDMSTMTDLWRPLLEDVRTVFHLAWTTKPQSANDAPFYDLQSNIMPGLHFLDGLIRLKKPPRLIFISTGGAIYGRVNEIPIPEDHPTSPINAYGMSKRIYENYLELYHRLHNLDYLIYRPGNPFGEGQDPAGAQGAIAVFLGRILNNKPITIWGNGEIIRDYLYIDDLIDAFEAGIDLKIGTDDPHIFNIGSGVGLSLNQVIEKLTVITGKKPDVRYEPPRSADTPSVVLDITRAKQWLNWSPRVTLEDGLARTWRWLCSREELRS